MIRLNQKGTVLLYAVIAMTAISVLGTGIYFLTSTSTFSGLRANQQNRAHQLALAGKDYALVKNRDNDTASKYPNGFTFTNGDKFRLVISGDTITSTGIVNENTPYEARKTISVTKTGFGSQADVSFTKKIDDFSKTIPTLQTNWDPNSPLTKVNVLGQVEMGQGKTYSFGGISYGGSAVQGNCNNGICDFNGGFRAYFKFKLVQAPSATGDPHGFVFTFFNGNNNLSTAIGGDLGVVSVSDMPELLGYAGDSCSARDASGICVSYLDATGKGIQPPKIAVEFDSRYQSCVLGACNPESRCDGTRNHIAYVFWGDLNTTLCKNEASPTYDDNRHGNGTVGSATEPRNSVASDTADTTDYFTGLSPGWTQPWLFGTVVTAPTFAVRVEVSRDSVKNINNNYFYRIRTWIKKCLVCDSNGTNCSPCDISQANCCAALTNFDNVKVAFNDMYSADLPNLDRTIELNQANHDLFSKLAFGWRFASGGSSPENVTISNFNMYFVK